MIGAVISDRLLGKYRTILWLSIVYACGSLPARARRALDLGRLDGARARSRSAPAGSSPASPPTSAISSGSATGSDCAPSIQAFYFIINFGSFFAYLLIPWTLEVLGVRVAFGIPGVLMVVATVVFWTGRNVFIHVPPSPGGRLGLLDGASSIAFFLAIGHLFFSRRPALAGDAGAVGRVHRRSARCCSAGASAWRPTTVSWRSCRSRSGRGCASRRGASGRPRARGSARRPSKGRSPSCASPACSSWSACSGRCSTRRARRWILQAQTMDLHLWDGFKVLPAQLQAANPALVMLLIPFASKVLYPTSARLGFEPTPLRRMTRGHGAGGAGVRGARADPGRHRSPGARDGLGRLAARRLLADHDGRGAGVDHRARVRLQPGAAPDEVDDHGVLAAGGVARQRGRVADRARPPAAARFVLALRRDRRGRRAAVRASARCFYKPRDYVQE